MENNLNLPLKTQPVTFTRDVSEATLNCTVETEGKAEMLKGSLNKLLHCLSYPCVRISTSYFPLKYINVGLHNKESSIQERSSNVKWFEIFYKNMIDSFGDFLGTKNVTA